MKIYTRTGDQGTTGLFGGGRVSKNNPRIEAYGTVDELNAFVGMVRTLLNAQPGHYRIEPVLEQIQTELFVLGADLATPEEARPNVPRIAASHVEQLEDDIDKLSDDLPPLKHFVLPGGTQAAAYLHMARTVCRRAERRAVEAAGEAAFNKHALIYLNRLSDLLFVMARWLNRQAGVDEAEWKAEPV